MLFFFWMGAGTSIDNKPEDKQTARKLQTHARKPKVVNRDTKSLTTKLKINLA
jgi:hypothetical protein